MEQVTNNEMLQSEQNNGKETQVESNNDSQNDSVVTKILERNDGAQINVQQNKDDTAKNLQHQVVTESMANQFGWAKSFVGKPINEIMKAYDNLNKEFTRRSQELAELRKISNSVSKTAEKKESSEKPIPDPEKQPKEYEAYLNQKAMEDARQKMAPLIQENIKREAELISQKIKEHLPQNTDYNVLLNDWKNKHADMLPYFVEHPDKLVSSVLQHYKASQYDSLNSASGENVQKEATKQAALMLKNVKQNTSMDSDHTFVDRQQMNSSLSPTLVKIIERNRK